MELKKKTECQMKKETEFEGEENWRRQTGV